MPNLSNFHSPYRRHIDIGLCKRNDNIVISDSHAITAVYHHDADPLHVYVELSHFTLSIQEKYRCMTLQRNDNSAKANQQLVWKARV